MLTTIKLDYLVVTAFVTIGVSSIAGLCGIPWIALLIGFLFGTVGTHLLFRYYHNKWAQINFTNYPKWKLFMWQAIVAAVFCNFGWNGLLL